MVSACASPIRSITAAALLKPLFEANWITRALFMVDHNTLVI